MEGDTHLYLTGSGPVVGFKTVRLAVRNDRTNSTIVLAVRQPDSKDEAACAVQAAIDVHRRLPGLLALSDTALRGTHICELARKARLTTVAPVAAASNTKLEHQGRRAPREEDPRREGRPPAARRLHMRAYLLRAWGPALRGDHRLPRQAPARALRRPTVRFRDNKTGHRLYLAWDITCSAGQPRGATPLKIKELSWTVTDDTSTFNVAENLRAFPPGSERYDEAHGWRQSIENDNHQSDARKTLRRGRSSLPEWNHLNELGWAIMSIGIPLQRHRREQATAA